MTKKLRKNSISILFLLLTVQSTVTMDNRSNMAVHITGAIAISLLFTFILYKKMYAASTGTVLKSVQQNDTFEKSIPSTQTESGVQCKQESDEKSFYNNIFENVVLKNKTIEQIIPSTQTEIGVQCKQESDEKPFDVESLPIEHPVFERYMKEFQRLRAQLKKTREQTISTDLKEKSNQEWKQKEDIHEYLIKLLNIICKGIVSIHQDFKNKCMGLIKADMLLFMDESYPNYKEICILEKLFLLGCKYNDTEVFTCMPRILNNALTPYDRTFSHRIFPIFDQCLDVAYLYQSDEVINLLYNFNSLRQFSEKLKHKIDISLSYLDNAANIIRGRLEDEKYEEYDTIAHFF